MNKYHILILKSFRKLYKTIGKEYRLPEIHPDMDADSVSEKIYNLLVSDKPAMIARFGAFELSTFINYRSVISKKPHSVINFIKGKEVEWWWDKGLLYKMQNNAGFFPATEKNAMRFGKLMSRDYKQLDLLSVWLSNIHRIDDLIKDIPQIGLIAMEPYWGTHPWTRALQGKRVLVIHPFAELIGEQYAQHREQLFENKAVLPKFKLNTIKAVQSIGGANSQYRDWFEALEAMKYQMDSIEYDIALIGCGAYGFHLAAHSKRTGHKAVHLGGALQLLFGIKGGRWETPNYGVERWGLEPDCYLKLFNEYWVRPGENEKPKNHQSVEDSCYW